VRREAERQRLINAMFRDRAVENLADKKALENHANCLQDESKDFNP
jgi:hypothetical protein